MNTLLIEKRVQIINLLVEGMSMRAVSKVAGCSINTVTKLLKDVGAACAAYQDQNVRGIKAMRVQFDEIWAFCRKERNVAPENKGVLGFGDVYTWTGMDAESKLMVSYMVGKRDADYADAFIADIASRLTNRVQLSTDGYKPHLEAAEGAFDCNVDYAMLVKHYGPGEQAGQRGFSPAEFVSAGNPDMDKVSTSFVERQNMAMRMGMRRLTHLTNGLSKKMEDLEHAVSLHVMNYNFTRIHKTLRVTPAMAAGISDHVWGLEEIAALVPEPIAKKRGPYKTRQKAISN
jgi:IS1 family transposase/lambda repressor-like predicted transcriptional regulator